MSPPLPQHTPDDPLPGNLEQQSNTVGIQYSYEVEVKVYQAFERLNKGIIVLHGFEFTDCDQFALGNKTHVKDGYKEWTSKNNSEDSDYLIIGETFIAVIEMKNTVTNDGNTLKTFQNSLEQGYRVRKLNQFEMDDAQKESMIFIENLDNFSKWCQENGLIADQYVALAINMRNTRDISDILSGIRNQYKELDIPERKNMMLPNRDSGHFIRDPISGMLQVSETSLAETIPGQVEAPEIIKGHHGVKYFTAEQEKTFNSEQKLPPPNVADNLGGYGNNLVAATVNNGLSKLIFIFYLLLNAAQCCERTCYSAYKDGSLDLQEVQDGSPTIVPINVTGVVTIEAAYIPGYKVGWEYIRFMRNEDLQPLVMQFYTPNDKYATTLSIFGEDEIGVYPDSRYSVYNLFNDSNDEITIQVSDVHVTEDNFYRIYLAEPGRAHSRNYSYQNKYNWEEIRSFMSFNTTTQIKTDNKAIYFKSVSVCSGDTPVLCGEAVEAIARSRGEAFNLSCSAYGAPYLEAVWSNVANTRQQLVHSENGFLQTSTVSVDNFNENHTGVWTCYWRNKNLGTVSLTKIFIAVELVSKPANGSYFTVNKDLKHGSWRLNMTLETNEQALYSVSPDEEYQTFTWVIKNNLSEESSEELKTLLDCKEGNSAIDSKYIEYEENSTVSEHSSTLILPETIRCDKITCTLYLVVKLGGNGTERSGMLDTTTHFREGYQDNTNSASTKDVMNEQGFEPRTNSNYTWYIILATVLFVTVLLVLILILIRRSRGQFKLYTVTAETEI